MINPVYFVSEMLYRVLLLVYLIVLHLIALLLVPIKFTLSICTFDKKFTSVLITGASSGLGVDIAKRYAKDGCHLHITARNEKRLDECRKACEALGANVSTYTGDITDAKRMEEIIKEADKIAPLDLVIANAAMAIIEEDPLKDAYLVMDVNATGALNTAIPALKIFVERGSGHVALISSSTIYCRGYEEVPTYTAAKSFVTIWGRGIAPRYRANGVNVTNIVPGLMATPMGTNEKTANMPRFMFTSTVSAANHVHYACKRSYSEYSFGFWPFGFMMQTFGVLKYQLQQMHV